MVVPASHRISRVPCYSGSSRPAAWLWGFHPLWRCFPTPSPRLWTSGSPSTPVCKHTGLGCSAFARHYSRNPFFSSGYSDVSLRPVPYALALTAYDRGRVSPFGYPWLSRLHTPRHGFSQCITSFIGTGRLGIHRLPFLAFSPFLLLRLRHKVGCVEKMTFSRLSSLLRTPDSVVKLPVGVFTPLLATCALPQMPTN